MQTIDTNGNLVSTGELQKKFKDPELAMTVYRIAMSLEIQASIASEGDKFVVTLTDATPEQVGLLERKTRITNWSKSATRIANNVTNALTQVGDYALNGALAPTAVSVANAVFTTGRVVGTAGVRVGAGTLASLAFNSRIAAKEIATSKEVGACITEVKTCIADAGAGLAKLFGIDAEGNLGGWEAPQEQKQQA